MLVKFSILSFILVSALQLNELKAAVLESPVALHDKLLVSITEGNLTLLSSNTAKDVKFNVSPGTENDYFMEHREGVLEFRSRDQLTKLDFGKISKNKKDLEIIIPAQMGVDLHVLEGTAVVSKLSQDLLAHVQKGRLSVHDCSGAMTLHSQKGEIIISDSSGRLSVDAYASSVLLKNYVGDIDLQNFSGDSTIEKVKGFLSLNLGSGATRVSASSGTLQFEQTKGVLTVATFGGRVEGQTNEGPVNVALTSEGDLNIKSQSGKVTVTTPPGSGALLNIATIDGDIYGPSYLKVNRDGGNKNMRGRMRGETQKSTILVRGQEASIIIK